MSNNIINEVFSILRGNEELIEESENSLVLHKSNPIGYFYTIEIGSFSEFIAHKIPRWINPLNFEMNLNYSMAALMEVDVILEEYSESSLKLVEASGTEKEDDVKAILEESKAGAKVRLLKKLEELLFYTLATQVGLKKIFDISPSEYEHTDQSSQLINIRETIRNINDRYRKLSKSYQATKIKVSLRHARKQNNDDLAISEAFLQGNENALPTADTHLLTAENFQVNLKEYAPLNNLNDVFLLDIGVQIIDQESRIPGRTWAANTYNNYPDSWDISVGLEDDDIDLGDHTQDTYDTPNLILSGVEASMNSSSVVMSKNQFITGIDPRDIWKLSISNLSLQRKEPKKSIYDIILHLDIVGKK